MYSSFHVHLKKILYLLIHFMKNILFVIPSIIGCVCFFLSNSKRLLPNAVRITYAGLFLTAISFFIYRIIIVIGDPYMYDFTAFFLWGKTAAQGYDFYLPQNLQRVFQSLQLPPENYSVFSEEIVDVGFLYPPPTILYFAPLGFLSYKVAVISWAIFNALFALGCIYLIYDLFFKKYKMNGLMLVTILFIFFKPVLQTVAFLQTNFIVLFYLLLVKKYLDKKIAGCFLALAMFTKPYMAILILFFLIKKKWQAVVYFLVGSAILVGITVLFFGVAPFRSYMFNNPALRIPEWVYSEIVNQSLHAVLIRLDLISGGKSLMYIQIVVVIVLLSIFYLVYLLERGFYDYVLPFLLLIGLLLYPGTLMYYGVLLLFVVFQFFDQKTQLAIANVYLITGIVAIFYGLSAVSTFLAICFLLLIIVFMSINELGQSNFRTGAR